MGLLDETIRRQEEEKRTAREAELRSSEVVRKALSEFEQVEFSEDFIEAVHEFRQRYTPPREGLRRAREIVLLSYRDETDPERKNPVYVTELAVDLGSGAVTGRHILDGQVVAGDTQTADEVRREYEARGVARMAALLRRAR